MFKEKFPVWAECNAKGEIRARGRGRMRYQTNGKEYSPHNRNLTAVEGTRPVHITDEGQVVQVPRPESPAPLSPPPLSAGTVIAYTDGSALHGRGQAGAAAWLKVDGSETLHTRTLADCTANRAELEAVGLVLEKLKLRNRALAIYTDSEFVAAALTGKLRHPAEGDLVRRLRRELSRFPAVGLVKVKGHSGIEKNELVHRAAKQAMREGIAAKRSAAADDGGER